MPRRFKYPFWGRQLFRPQSYRLRGEYRYREIASRFAEHDGSVTGMAPFDTSVAAVVRRMSLGELGEREYKEYIGKRFESMPSSLDSCIYLHTLSTIEQQSATHLPSELIDSTAKCHPQSQLIVPPPRRPWRALRRAPRLAGRPLPRLVSMHPITWSSRLHPRF